MDPVAVALVSAVIAAFVGSVVAGGFTIWGVRVASKAARDLARGQAEGAERASNIERVRRRHLERIGETRRLLNGRLDQWSALAVGDLTAAQVADAKATLGEEHGNIAIVGEVDLVRDYQDLVIHLRERFGRRLTADDQVRVIRVQGRIAAALDEQEDRALRGEDLATIDFDKHPDLFDTDRLATRLRLPDRRPSIPARLARWWTDRLVRGTRYPDPPSDD